MANFQDYLDLAEIAYAQRAGGQPQLPGWSVQRWEWATWYGDGYQGGIFETANEIVVAFSGTHGSPLTAPMSQTSANVRIGVNVIPNMAGSAFSMVNWAKERAWNRPISIVGHSLGGGLAQVVGNWAGLPFVSFNGPGMKRHLKMSAFNIFKPRQAFRSIVSANTDDSIGLCVNVKGDFTAEYGVPVGQEVKLTVGQGNNLHSLDSIFIGLNGKGWRPRTPRDVYSLWPAPPAGTRGRR